MRIGMILDKTFPPDPRVENEAISLINGGHEVFLFCLKYNSQEADLETINNILVCRYSANKWEYKLSALVFTIPLYTALMKKKILHFLNKNRIEAIHIHDIRIAEAVYQSNKKLKLPTVLDLHDNMPEIIKFYPHLQKFPGKQIISPNKWRKKEEEFISKANKVITVSEEFIEEVIERTKISKEKIILVPNTVQRAFYKDAFIDGNIIKKYKDQFVILYLGDTAIRRGLLTAIDAIDELKSKIANIRLVIVGKSTTDNVLKDRVNELQLGDYIEFTGWQDVKLFPSYIKASSICISPLYRNKQHDVAYANKLFQYMSFAKPVLVSDATAQKKLINKTNSGLVHGEKDVKDFTNKVLDLYNDPELRNDLGKNGRYFIENEFCWERVSKNLVDIYKVIGRQ